MMREHGQATRYFHDAIGYNYRMDGFQGAVLRVKLRHLEEWTRKRQEYARMYKEILIGGRSADATAHPSPNLFPRGRGTDSSPASDPSSSKGVERGRISSPLGGEDQGEGCGGRVQFPEDDPRDESVYHLFVVYVDNRDAVRAALEARGVHTAVHYPRGVHVQKAYAQLGYQPGSLPHTERACERALSLPLFPEMTAAQVEYAARTLAELAGKT
jgi:dTDP-4-amino-4,6-dideoxygalactose transaminase